MNRALLSCGATSVSLLDMELESLLRSMGRETKIFEETMVKYFPSLKMTVNPQTQEAQWTPRKRNSSQIVAIRDEPKSKWMKEPTFQPDLATCHTQLPQTLWGSGRLTRLTNRLGEVCVKISWAPVNISNRLNYPPNYTFATQTLPSSTFRLKNIYILFLSKWIIINFLKNTPFLTKHLTFKINFLK